MQISSSIITFFGGSIKLQLLNNDGRMGLLMVKEHTLHKIGQKGKENSRIIHLGIFLFMVNTEISQGNM